MDRSVPIKLIAETYTADSIGQYVPTQTSRDVYASVKSISRAEWFDAGRNGFKPSYVFTMFSPDYQGEKIVEYNSVKYGVYRTYMTKNESIELYCEEKAGV